MITVDVRTNIDQLIQRLDQRVLVDLPKAVAAAVNRTAEDTQIAIRQRIRQRGFTIRSAQNDRWLTNQVMINRGDRATKQRLRAAVSVGMGFSSSSGKTLLPLIDAGGVRTSRRQIGHGSLFADGSVAVPIRMNPMDQIPRGLYPSAVGLQAYAKIEGGTFRAGRGKHSRRKVAARLKGMLMKGSSRTFAIRTKPGQGLIFQRQGSSKGARQPGTRDPNLRALFTIKPFVHVPARDFFYSVGVPTARRRFPVNLAGMLWSGSNALRRAYR